VEVIGHREAAGRPALFATTKQFLDDLGLQSLDQLPLLESPADAGDVFGALVETVPESVAIEGQIPMVLDVDEGATDAPPTDGIPI
jgi:segregation and condensation protein B